MPVVKGWECEWRIGKPNVSCSRLGPQADRRTGRGQWAPPMRRRVRPLVSRPMFGYFDIHRRGVAQFGSARLTGGQEVAGSNPVAPIWFDPSNPAPLRPPGGRPKHPSLPPQSPNKIKVPVPFNSRGQVLLFQDHRGSGKRPTRGEGWSSRESRSAGQNRTGRSLPVKSTTGTAREARTRCPTRPDNRCRSRPECRWANKPHRR